MNEKLKTNTIEIDPRLALVLLCLVCVTLISTTASAENLSLENNPHRFTTGPMNADAAKETGIDKDALAQAVWSVLKYDHSQMEFEEVKPIVLKIINAAEKADVDPFVAVTIVFQESRYKVKALGDGGRACGMAQQHAKFSMKWGLSNTMAQFKEVRDPKKRFWLRHKHECELLRNPDYAARVLAYHLQLIKLRASPLRKYVWFYNGRERYQGKHVYWRNGTEDVYQKILERRGQKELAKNP